MGFLIGPSPMAASQLLPMNYRVSRSFGSMSGPGMPLTREVPPVKTLGMPGLEAPPPMSTLGLPSTASAEERAASSGTVSPVQVAAAYKQSQRAASQVRVPQFLIWA